MALMLEDSGSVPYQLIVLALFFVFAFLGPAVTKWLKQREEAKGEAQPEEGPEPEDPKLPYEDVVDQVFGPYMQRRRAAYKARQAAEAGEVVVIKTAPAEPVIRIIEESPAPRIAQEAAAPHVTAPPARSLDDAFFGNRPLSPAAKLVLSAEILQRPRAFRRPLTGR